jgi:hypothetical protein
MHKVALLAIAAALISAGTAGWVATTTQARVEAPIAAERIHPSGITMKAENLPLEEFVDYSFVFN